MAGVAPTWRRVKTHRTYTVEEAARVFGVHKNTIRSWLREGLEPLDQNRPLLIHGATLAAFLKQRSAARKHPCRPDEFYCFRCRAPRLPAFGMVDAIHDGRSGIDLTALCDTCETVMHKRSSRSLLAAPPTSWTIQHQRAREDLTDAVGLPQNCDLE
ncbi:MAG: helix-turn-helix domain-containing protein [Rhodospirillaceae bacterium]|nr:helix-turn-helix domain-containing protein [Rhodospirillaceae bacterium]